METCGGEAALIYDAELPVWPQLRWWNVTHCRAVTPLRLCSLKFWLGSNLSFFFSFSSFFKHRYSSKSEPEHKGKVKEVEKPPLEFTDVSTSVLIHLFQQQTAAESFIGRTQAVQEGKEDPEVHTEHIIRCKIQIQFGDYFWTTIYHRCGEHEGLKVDFKWIFWGCLMCCTFYLSSIKFVSLSTRRCCVFQDSRLLSKRWLISVWVKPVICLHVDSAPALSCTLSPSTVKLGQTLWHNQALERGIKQTNKKNTSIHIYHNNIP